MINDKNKKTKSEKAGKTESFNYKRCDQETLENISNNWQDPDYHDGEKKIKMCNSYYGLIPIKDEK